MSAEQRWKSPPRLSVNENPSAGEVSFNSHGLANGNAKSFHTTTLFSPTMKQIRESFGEYTATSSSSSSPTPTPTSKKSLRVNVARNDRYDKTITIQEPIVTSPSSSRSLSKKLNPAATSSDDWNPQFSRINKLWQGTKDELEETKRELQETKERYYRLGAHQRYLKVKEEEAETLGLVNRKLKDKLDKTELHLEKHREENKKYADEVNFLNTQLRDLSMDLTNANEKEEQQRLQIKQLTRALEDKDAFVHESKSHSLAVQRETSDVLRTKDELLSQQHTRQKELMLESARLRASQEQSTKEIHSLEKQLSDTKALCYQLECMNETARNELAQERSKTADERKLQMQLYHLEIDNKRLLHLISLTKEYQAFKFFKENSGGYSYIGELSTMEKKEQQQQQRQRQPQQQQQQQQQEQKKKNETENMEESNATFSLKNPMKDKESLQEWGQAIHRLASNYEPCLQELTQENKHGRNINNMNMNSNSNSNSNNNSYHYHYYNHDPQHDDAYQDKTKAASFLWNQQVDAFSEEEKHWVPTDAVHLAHEFKYQHLLSLPMDIIYEFLRQLNVIWRQREKENLAKMKQSLSHEYESLKRQLKNQVPYANMMQQNEIARLKKEICHLLQQRYTHKKAKNMKQLFLGSSTLFLDEKERGGELQNTSDTLCYNSSLHESKSKKDSTCMDKFSKELASSFLVKTMATTEALHRRWQVSQAENVSLKKTLTRFQKEQERLERMIQSMSMEGKQARDTKDKRFNFEREPKEDSTLQLPTHLNAKKLSNTRIHTQHGEEENAILLPSTLSSPTSSSLLPVTFATKRMEWFQDGVHWLQDRMHVVSNQLVKRMTLLLNDARKTINVIKNYNKEATQQQQQQHQLIQLLGRLDTQLREYVVEYRKDWAVALKDAKAAAEHQNMNTLDARTLY